MPENASPADQSEMPQCAAHPQRVVLANLKDLRDPWGDLRSAAKSVVALVILAIFGLVFGDLSALSISRAEVAMLAAGIVLIFVLLWPAAVLLSWLRDRSKARVELSRRGEPRAISADVEALLHTAGGLVPRPFWKSVRGYDSKWFQESLRSLEHPDTITIVDSRYRRLIDSIDLVDRFMEPETIDSRPRIDTTLAVLFGLMFLAGIATVFNGMTSWTNPVLIAAGVLMFWQLMGPVIWVRAFGIGAGYAPVANMGVVSAGEERHWTVNDSCMLVRTNGRRLLAEFIGPAGYLRIEYQNAADAGFRELWQRWMHPHPRPELV